MPDRSDALDADPRRTAAGSPNDLGADLTTAASTASSPTTSSALPVYYHSGDLSPLADVLERGCAHARD